MNKYDVEYFRCDNCGFIQTEDPYWLGQAYQKPITDTDIGLIERNVIYSKIFFVLLPIFFSKRDNFLDYAGGYGIFTRLMRNYGYKFYNYDLYVKNVFSSEFNYSNQKIDAVTCFECFEHLAYPSEDIKKILTYSHNIFFSTVLLPEPVPNKEWWYYSFHHGQHIAFYSQKSLVLLAKENGLRYYSLGRGLHFFTEKKIPRVIFMLSILFAYLSVFINLDTFFKRYGKT